MLKLNMKWIVVAALSVAVLAGTAWSQGLSPRPQTEGFRSEIQPEAFDTAGFEPGQGRMRQRGPGRMRRHGAPTFREQLGLTEEQTERLRALRSEAAKSGIRTRAELRIKRLELRELLQAEEPDRGLIEKKVREISDARAAAQMQRIDQRLAFRSVLTPEQREKMRNLRKQFRQRRGGRGFGSGPRRFGPRRRGSGPGRGMEPTPEPAEPPLD